MSRPGLKAFLACYVLLAFSMFAGTVAGDIEPNDRQYQAETLEDKAEGSLYSTSEDYVDWYVMDISPYTTVRVTLHLTSPSGNIHCVSYQDGLEVEGSINISVSFSSPDDSGAFRSEGGFEELYLEVSGDGSYELEVKRQQELFGGCCLGFMLLGGLPLIGGFIYIRYRSRN